MFGVLTLSPLRMGRLLSIVSLITLAISPHYLTPTTQLSPKLRSLVNRVNRATLPYVRPTLHQRTFMNFPHTTGAIGKTPRFGMPYVGTQPLTTGMRQFSSSARPGLVQEILDVNREEVPLWTDNNEVDFTVNVTRETRKVNKAEYPQELAGIEGDVYKVIYTVKKKDGSQERVTCLMTDQGAELPGSRWGMTIKKFDTTSGRQEAVDMSLRQVNFVLDRAKASIEKSRRLMAQHAEQLEEWQKQWEKDEEAAARYWGGVTGLEQVTQEMWRHIPLAMRKKSFFDGFRKFFRELF